ncbi:MAG: ABC transporter substrate-binding protein [Xanthobacteraceae bacterium]|nr:ABC transporter substrate-binding protein [Xanthobacteraceae bacterium]
MRSSMKLIAAATALVASATVVSAQEELKIGVMSALSGPGAAWGKAFYHGAQMATDDYNAEGGVEVAGKKYKIRLIPYDTKYSAAEALPAANRLIFGDGVKIIVGPFSASEAIATQDLTTKQKVLTFVFAWSPRVLGTQYPYQFRISTTSSEFTEPQIRWISSKLKLTKVAGLFPNDEFGQQSSKQVAATYQKIGTDFSFQLFERDRVDFVPLLTGLLAKGVDGFELDGNSPVTAGLIVKQLRELGFTGPIVRTGGPATKEIIDIAGASAADGLYYHSPVDPTDKSVIAFEQRYKQKYKEDMNDNTPAFYDGTRVLLQALKAAGTTTDTDKIVAATEQVKDFKGLTGNVGWGGNESYGINRQVQAPFYIVQLRNGKKVPVAKCDWKRCTDLAQ